MRFQSNGPLGTEKPACAGQFKSAEAVLPRTLDSEAGASGLVSTAALPVSLWLRHSFQHLGSLLGTWARPPQAVLIVSSQSSFAPRWCWLRVEGGAVLSAAGREPWAGL